MFDNPTDSTVLNELRLLATSLETGKDSDQLEQERALKFLSELQNLRDAADPAMRMVGLKMSEMIKGRIRETSRTRYDDFVDEMPLLDWLDAIPVEDRQRTLAWLSNPSEVPLGAHLDARK
jgi:hypothetical protein